MKTKPLAILPSERSSTRIRFVLLLVAVFLSALNTSAQKKVTHQQLVWYGYYNSLTFNENWSLKSEIQERQFINPTAQHQLVFRTNLERKLVENWNTSAGITLFLQSPNDPNSESNLMVPELRPDLGFNNKQKLSFLTISHRYKAEARFFHDVENNELVGGYRFSNIRLRYQLGLDFPVWKQDGQEKLIFKAKDEVMFNLGSKIVKNTFDQNRVYLALNYVLSPSLAVEAGYMNWFQQQKSGVDFYNRDIIRFSVFHNLNLKKKKHE
ncbi:DUF2490 domain-containing protein [Flavobacterium sp. SM15]|uniref:DUF2490 domain-containing protein n=1 Tax=Flavobacterium sp. SM15 TaxID=2908005 RepID=UPI001ED9F7B4|nr:DUF2490 domain-containing protein [Flavobacterium sp. SM15]MCG2612355.1 DUF2490 domain-containing protein [Flavobacterium sp. SM15]